MAEMQHFPSVSYVSGGLTVHLNYDRFSAQFAKAQWWFGEQVLADCKPIMPFRTGTFQRLSHTENGGARVVFPGPAGRFLYGGLVMVDPDTGSPFARPGVKKVLTDRHLIYSNADATDHWFDTAEARNKEHWLAGTKRIAGTGG